MYYFKLKYANIKRNNSLGYKTNSSYLNKGKPGDLCTKINKEMRITNSP